MVSKPSSAPVFPCIWVLHAIWNVRRDSKAVRSPPDRHGVQAPDCWAVAFGNSFTDEERCLLAGYSDGHIRLFDLRTNTMRWQASPFLDLLSASRPMGD